ncbi:MAG TPA: polyprenyl synthetase family protein [Actinomycetota bacterium]|nr:polyprenyl synthetase family protein [Actinomycetota bacterium]
MAIAGFPALTDVASRIDALLAPFVDARRSELAAIDPRAIEPIDEIARLLEAGGKRLRPAFCFWGYRAAGGVEGEAIWQASAALELLHTMALIHDDVMDADLERRGQPTAQARQIAAAVDRGQSDPALVGLGVAIVTGDLAAALAEQLFATAAFPPDRLAAAAQRFHRMRLVLAAGTYLDLAQVDAEPGVIAFLKGGAYTVEGPLLIGSALAGAAPHVDDVLRAYARPLGEAFQLLDDLADGDAPGDATRADATELVARATAALAGDTLAPDAVQALHQLADLVESL